WHDEFDGTTLNPSKWQVALGGNNANNEWEIYAAPNVYVTNGTLVLKSDRLWDTGGNPYYTSGKVTSAGRFDQLYGWFEWSGQIPAGQGFWPAYWMLSYAGWPPEIDIMETVGTSVYCNTMSLHWGPLPPGCDKPWDCGHTEGGTYCGPNFSGGFHTYAVDWEPWGAAWYVDGVQQAYANYLGNCTNSMYLIMNTAVGGDWPGAPDSSTPFPSYNLVDYVRVWKPLSGRYTLLNPGFEQGEGVADFNDWNSYESGNVIRDPTHGNPRSGNRCVQIWGRYTGQDNTSGLYQDLAAYSGELWQASVWGRSRPFDQVQGGNQGRLKLEFVDSSGNLLARTMQTVITNGTPTNYAQCFVRGVAPANTARARIVLEYFQTGNADGSVNFDDARLDLLSAQWLTNSGFESATLDGWNVYGPGWDAAAAWSPDPVHSGGFSFKVFGGDFTGGSANFAGVYQDSYAEPGACYFADGWLYTKSSDRISGADQAWLELTFRDAGGSNILALFRSASVTAASPPDTWLYLPISNQYDPGTYTFTGTVTEPVAPPGTALARYQVVFFQQYNAGGSVFCDDLSLVRTPGCGAPPAVRLSARFSGGVPVLSFPTVTGHVSQVLYKNDLSQAQWNLLTTVPGDGSTKWIIDSPAGAARFYRLVVE
ncbi:MAG TPA: glycoside hydrolase family 16 protein, partial [Candidatus Acidoferrum sp.]|nr:glycoside hydrolase family 16 protein [Candidatus Acidoferrum sp.]